MQTCDTNQLPRVEHTEGSTFDRIFTLLNRNGAPYLFSLSAVASFVVRTRLDYFVASFTADILPTPGQVRLRLTSAQTANRVGRFLWSGTVTDGAEVTALEANEFYIVEGISGEFGEPIGTPDYGDLLTEVDVRIANHADNYGLGAHIPLLGISTVLIQDGAVTLAKLAPGLGGGGGGGSGATPDISFTQASLTVASILPVPNHGLGVYPSAIAIYDEIGNQVMPDHWRALTLNSLEIGLESYAPITGTWILSITA